MNLNIVKPIATATALLWGAFSFAQANAYRVVPLVPQDPLVSGSTSQVLPDGRVLGQIAVTDGGPEGPRSVTMRPVVWDANGTVADVYQRNFWSVGGTDADIVTRNSYTCVVTAYLGAEEDVVFFGSPFVSTTDKHDRLAIGYSGKTVLWSRREGLSEVSGLYTWAQDASGGLYGESSGLPAYYVAGTLTTFTMNGMTGRVKAVNDNGVMAVELSSDGLSYSVYTYTKSGGFVQVVCPKGSAAKAVSPDGTVFMECSGHVWAKPPGTQFALNIDMLLSTPDWTVSAVSDATDSVVAVTAKPTTAGGQYVPAVLVRG